MQYIRFVELEELEIPNRFTPQECAKESGLFADLYFLTFYILTNFILLNLFVAVMLENFEFNMNVGFAITREDIALFRRQWHAEGLTVPRKTKNDLTHEQEEGESTGIQTSFKKNSPLALLRNVLSSQDDVHS